MIKHRFYVNKCLLNNLTHISITFLLSFTLMLMVVVVTVYLDLTYINTATVLKVIVVRL